MTGPHADEFWRAMDKEINCLHDLNTWTVVPRNTMPMGVRSVPGTWALRIKRYPDGRLHKFKARFCVMGNLMTKGEHYDGESYSPLVGWPTVRAALVLAAAKGWKSRQVDFTNAFCQAPQEGDLYVELPQYYKPDGVEDPYAYVLKLK